MEMKFCLFADYAGEGQRGKLLAVGIFDQMFAGPDRPIVLPLFYIAAHFEAHTVEGTEHQFQIRMVSQDHEPINQGLTLPVKFRPQGPGRPLKVALVIPVAGLMVPDLGIYEFTFQEGGRLIGSAAFHVVAAPQQGP